jgi:putative flippase GtrA
VRTQHTGVARSAASSPTSTAAGPEGTDPVPPVPHSETPLPDTSGPLGAIVARIRTKGPRYVMVSVVNVVVGAGLLYVLQRWMRPTFANITSVAIGAVPAYYMSRAWVWGKRGKSHWKKEVLPFWVFTAAGLVLSTAAISFTDDHTKNRLAILFVQLVAFGILWVLRFFLLDKLFHVEIYEDDTPDED